jgi:hypothetical protein
MKRSDVPVSFSVVQPLNRRSVLQGGGLLAIAIAAGIDLAACSSGSSERSSGSRRQGLPVLDDHERAVLEAATHRLVPGPQDDPAESGHPGAREAKAADYIVTLLGALGSDPPRVYAGGPFSDRAGSDHDDMADFLPLHRATTAHWRARLRELVGAYHAGLRQLDTLAGGDFTRATPAAQDAALARNPKVEHLPADSSGFTDLLFGHTIEGCYSVPEYGGNTGLVMWRSIGFPGDVQPRGYTGAQVTEPDEPDPYRPSKIVTDVLQLLTSTAPGAPS